MVNMRTKQRVVQAARRTREAYRSAHNLGITAPLKFRLARRESEYQAVYDHPEPLVSICIGTYNRAELLRERSLASAIAQTYSNIEIVVVGDCCTDDTTKVMAEVRDRRVIFENLPQRGAYPTDPRLRWMVAGTATMNRALELARGDFITHLDDDDEHSLDRIQKLLECARDTKADLIYHPFTSEQANGDWLLKPAGGFRVNEVTTSSIFYHRWFRKIPWDPSAYLFQEPGDWNRLRKIRYLGARAIRHPGVLLSHYRERSQRQD